jgi:hypothetical protein
MKTVVPDVPRDLASVIFDVMKVSGIPESATVRNVLERIVRHYNKLGAGNESEIQCIS